MPYKNPEGRKAHLSKNRKHINARQRVCWAKNSEHFNAQKRAYNAQAKREAMAAYGKICQHCGEGDVSLLVLDHVNDDGAARRKAGEPTSQRLYRWLRKQGYPAGFQVLCHNCNHGKRPDVDYQHDDLDGLVMTGARWNEIWNSALENRGA